MKQYQADFPWTENKNVFCFTSFVFSTRSFDWDLDSWISGQIGNSFGQGKYTVIWLLVREFKNHASRNHVSTSSCMLRIEKLVIFNMTMIDIDYYRLLSIIGLSINYVWWIECLEDNLERWAVWVFESMGKVGFSETLPWYR